MAVKLARRLSLRDLSYTVLNFVFCPLRPATNHAGVKIGFLFFSFLVIMQAACCH